MDFFQPATTFLNHVILVFDYLIPLVLIRQNQIAESGMQRQGNISEWTKKMLTFRDWIILKKFLVAHADDLFALVYFSSWRILIL